MFFSVWQRATSNAGSSHWHPWAGSVCVVVMHSMHWLALGLTFRCWSSCMYAALNEDMLCVGSCWRMSFDTLDRTLE